MNNRKYIVRLEPREREDLLKLVSKGKAAARKLTHARILLQSDVSEGGPGWTDEQIATALGVTTRTVEHIRQRCVEIGLEATLGRKKREGSPTPRILDGAKEAKLVAICGSEAPEGRTRWTLDLLSDRLGVLDRQGLDERIGEKSELVQEVSAWEEKRNGETATIDWQFTTTDARIKLRRLYPKL